MSDETTTAQQVATQSLDGRALDQAAWSQRAERTGSPAVAQYQGPQQSEPAAPACQPPVLARPDHALGAALMVAEGEVESLLDALARVRCLHEPVATHPYRAEGGPPWRIAIARTRWVSPGEDELAYYAWAAQPADRPESEGAAWRLQHARDFPTAEAALADALAAIPARLGTLVIPPPLEVVE